MPLRLFRVNTIFSVRSVKWRHASNFGLFPFRSQVTSSSLTSAFGLIGPPPPPYQLFDFIICLLTLIYFHTAQYPLSDCSQGAFSSNVWNWNFKLSKNQLNHSILFYLFSERITSRECVCLMVARHRYLFLR